MIVADTNLIAHLQVPGPDSDAAQTVCRMDADWRAPSLWRSEFRNVLWLLVRHRNLLLADALAALERAERLVRDETIATASKTILRLAAESGCSPYDCEFAILARELRCPLVTSDRALLKAFPGSAVSPRAFIRARS